MKLSNFAAFFALLGFSIPAFGAGYKIGFSNPGEGDTWKQFLVANYKHEASLHKDITFSYKQAKDRVQVQIEQIEEFIKEGVNALIVLPGSDTLLDPVLKKAKEKGIKIITVVGSVNDKTLFDSHIASDDIEMGRVMAKWLAEELKHKGNIVMFSGIKGASSAENRLKGAREYLKGEKDIKVLAHKYVFWQSDKAKNEMENFLKTFGAPDGIWADSGIMSWPALDVMKKQGLKLPPSTGDHINGYVKFLNENKARGIVYPLPSRQIRLAIQSAIKLVNGEKVPKIQTFPVEYYTPEKQAKIFRPAASDFWWPSDDNFPKEFEPKL